MLAMVSVICLLISDPFLAKIVNGYNQRGVIY